jgi:DNA-directed RNA polymerase subunit alpha
VLVDTRRPLSVRWRDLLPRSSPFEAALALTAAIVEALSVTDRVLELLIAGPEVYRFVSAGRVGYFEDVLDILLNCKSVPVNSRSRELEIGRLVVNGPATVTASDLQFSSQVQVIDADRPIAIVAEGHSLELEVHVERGIGYRPVERHNEDTSAIDLLQIDAVFMPVRRVNYSVDETAVGEGGSARERLRLEIETNGSITPDDAMAQAANQLISLFQPLATLTMIEEPGLEPQPSAEAQIPLEELNLSVRAYNCLKRAQVNSVSDLMGFSYEDLLEIKNFGSKSADEVIEALERIGISLPQSRTSA